MLDTASRGNQFVTFINAVVALIQGGIYTEEIWRAVVLGGHFGGLGPFPKGKIGMHRKAVYDIDSTAGQQLDAALRRYDLNLHLIYQFKKLVLWQLTLVDEQVAGLVREQGWDMPTNHPIWSRSDAEANWDFEVFNSETGERILCTPPSELFEVLDRARRCLVEGQHDANTWHGLVQEAKAVEDWSILACHLVAAMAQTNSTASESMRQVALDMFEEGAIAGDEQAVNLLMRAAVMTNDKPLLACFRQERGPDEHTGIVVAAIKAPYEGAPPEEFVQDGDSEPLMRPTYFWVYTPMNDGSS